LFELFKACVLLSKFNRQIVPQPHACGPAVVTLLSLICDCVRGTAHDVQTSGDLRSRRPTSVTS